MGNKGKRVEAVAYIRTSSAANVGADKDSDKRQRAAIEGYAKRAGLALVGEFTDAAGVGRIQKQPGCSNVRNIAINRVTDEQVGIISVFDAAVDGSSTGTRVPWIWGLLMLPQQACGHQAAKSHRRSDAPRTTLFNPNLTKPLCPLWQSLPLCLWPWVSRG